MGLSFSCPLAAAYNREIEQHVVIEPVIVESISFGDDDKAKTPVRTISFMDRHSNPTIMGSGKMIQGSVVSFRAGDTQLMNLLNAPALSEQDLFITQTTSSDGKEINTQSPLRSDDSMTEKISQLPLLDSSNPKHEAAAIKLQKVYKSFRTRRKLADCAVLIEQSWWKLLDFAQLKHCSISFFDVEKHETAISRWSRARKRAAKVGKGLSKNAKAQKLALQHWLEAIDPRHRYGHNLHFYYVNWLHSQSNEPFFYWLDIGEGKEVNLFEKCCRSKLQQQCIKYLGPKERKVYKVVIEDGKLLYKQSGELLDSSKGSKGTKWIFVLSTSRTLYVGQKKKGTFQHSSFLAGGATLAAGRLVVENGILKAVWPHSGHYKPTPENFQDFLSFLEENCVDITDVKMDSVDEEQESVDKKFISHMRSNSSDEDLNEKLDYLEMEEEIDAKNLTLERSTSTAKETDDSLVRLKSENGAVESNSNTFWVESSLDGYNTAEESFDYSEQNDVKAAKQNLFDEEDRETFEETIILQRINSHKGMKSYQLGKQLSCKWSTGAGPRIGCLRDYPSGLQSHALEQANLSPRSAPSLRSSTSLSRVFTTTSFRGEIQEARSHILEDGLSTTLITATDN